MEQNNVLLLAKRGLTSRNEKEDFKKLKLKDKGAKLRIPNQLYENFKTQLLKMVV